MFVVCCGVNAWNADGVESTSTKQCFCNQDDCPTLRNPVKNGYLTCILYSHMNVKMSLFKLLCPFFDMRCP